MPSNVISQSEVDQFLSCRRKHWYAFGEPNSEGGHGIQPNAYSDSLTRGTIGHELLANFYEGLKSGSSLADSQANAINLHLQEANENFERMELYSQTLNLFTQYVGHYMEELPFIKPLAIEQEFRFEIPNSDLIFPFKPDIIWQDTRSGKVYLVDNKFLYNFYAPRVLGMMPQMPKYATALRAMGYRIDFMMYNILSTRKNVKEPFKRIMIPDNESANTQFMSDQVNVMESIRQEKLKWEATGKPTPAAEIRTASSFNCGHCPFLDLCTADLQNHAGRDKYLAAEFSPNSYRYAKELEGVDESE